MKSYKTRKEEAEELIKESKKEGIELYKELYLSGVSLRIIQELTGVSRSKLQRFFSENNIKRDDDLNTKKRKINVETTKNMLNDGYSVKDISKKLFVHEKTVKCYIRELGLEATDFGWGDLD